MAEISSLIGNISVERFLLFLFVIILTFILGSLANILVIRFMKEKVRAVIYKPISRIAMYSVYALGIFLAFNNIIHFNVPAGLAALGVLGVAVLLPAVPVLQNIAAGVVLAFERPFNEEDIVEINNTLCKVKDIMLRKTRFRAMDGRIITVPNLVFMTTASIINYSKGEFIKVVLNADISHESDRAKAIQVIQNICSENPNILPNIPQKKLNAISRFIELPKHFFTIPRNIKMLNPQVMIKNVSEKKISLEIWFWIWDITSKEKIVSSFYEKLVQEFAKEGVKFS